MLGYIHFDSSGSDNRNCEVLLTSERAKNLVRNRFIKILDIAENKDKPRIYIGRITEGPFFLPEEVSRESALAQTAILHGDQFPSVPNYYAIAKAEILGEKTELGLTAAVSRPNPQSKVEELPASEIGEYLDLEGDILLGRLEGYDDILVHLKSTKKSIIPRNIGIFGTVGSGKTNTAQVLIEELVEANWAIIVVDVEGEYIKMDSPTGELQDKLKKLNIEPCGLESRKFEVYKLSCSESQREDLTDVTLQTDQIDPLLLCEIIEATEPQTGVILKICEDLGKPRKKKKGKGIEPGATKGTSGYTLRDILSVLYQAIEDKSVQQDLGATGSQTILALVRKFRTLVGTGAFDDESASFIDPEELLKSNLVSVFDVSNTGIREKNLLIAELLDRVFQAKIKNPDFPPTMILIEEAHTFISRHTVERMRETVEKLREIARRGRKRWLGLTFISQQPSHLPNEIFELCNTRIVHSIRSETNINIIKRASGDIGDEMWNIVPSLAVGQALIDSPQYRNPILIDMRPCKTGRMFIG